jgi:hypothetical protein
MCLNSLICELLMSLKHERFLNMNLQSSIGSRAPGVLFINGQFFAPNAQHEGHPFHNCMFVRDGVIEHVGAEKDDVIARIKESGVLIQDMHNRTVLPGFIDSHMHLLLLGQSLQKVGLEECQSLEDIRSTIKAYAQSHPSIPRICCRGWMHSMSDGKAEANMLDDLDDRPIFIDSKDLHSAWCNSAALKELGIESMTDPTGGTIHRYSNGKASGLLSEAAVITHVWPHLARAAPMHEKIAALKAVLAAYITAGYTGIVDMAMDENAWEALLTLRSQEELLVRISAYWLITPSTDVEANLAQVNRAIALNKQYGLENSPDFRIAGIKVICDGVIDACTAALCEPYSNGISVDPLWTMEMLSPVVRRADEAGLQCALHAIGDNTIKLAVDAIEKNGTPGRRHRIEHLELASPEDAKRLGRLGITASVQPVHADPAILRAWPNLIGEHRHGRAFAYSEFLEAGATLALGTDSPTAPYAPLPNLYTATTRRSAREPEMEATVNGHFSLSLCAAIAAATEGAAYSCFADKRTGSLKPGLKADFTVLDMDWMPSKLLQARVHQTWLAGRKVYDSLV